MNKIGLLIIATNKYIQFLKPLIESSDSYFLPNQDVTYFVFTNQDLDINSNRNIIKVETEHREWPWMTLGRYKIFSNNSDILSGMDYLYYCDADMRFENEVGDEILGDLVATQHCGHYKVRGTPETNPNSLAYIDSNEEMEYLAGGFNGGSSYEYLKMSKILSSRIDDDYNRGIIAVWHDESHLNRYLIDNKPTILLDPGYCFHEGSRREFNKRLIALLKNHSEIRD
jgi:histo-blood group ABO system transferase